MQIAPKLKGKKRQGGWPEILRIQELTQDALPLPIASWVARESLAPTPVPGVSIKWSCSVAQTKSPYVAQAGLKLLNSSDSPASASQNAGITGYMQAHRLVIRHYD
ncbi:hypothetical protein AAY473_040217 [Plecturocebus cupreus]